MDKLFKIIVLGSLAIQIIWFFIPFYWEHFYNAEQLNLLSWAGYDSIININSFTTYALLAANIIASIGLITYKKWARSLYFSLVIVTIISSPLWGFAVSPPFDNVLGYIISVADGAILIFAYFTSLSSKFENAV